MSRRARAVVALVAATPVLSVLPGALVGAPAAAATCAAGGGVSVVVDFNGLGSGGVATGCVAEGGGDVASDLFAAAGHELTRAQRQPGFVCRVDAVPADDPCVNTSPASAYWGLWWSDGESGEWTYSSLGVDSLEVPDGGSVAFAWDDVEGSAPPSATPPRAAPSASPSSGSGSGAAGGSGGGTAGPTTSPGTPAPTASGAPSASATASTGPGREARSLRQRLRDVDPKEERDERIRTTSSPLPTEDATASASAAPDAEITSDPAAAADEEAGLPVWVAPLAVLVLAAAAGATVLLRRRSTP